MCATLSIKDGLDDVEQAQAGIQAQCEDKRFLSSVLTPSVRAIAESVAEEIHGRLRGEDV